MRITLDGLSIVSNLDCRINAHTHPVTIVPSSLASSSLIDGVSVIGPVQQTEAVAALVVDPTPLPVPLAMT